MAPARVMDMYAFLTLVHISAFCSWQSSISLFDSSSDPYNPTADLSISAVGGYLSDEN